MIRISVRAIRGLRWAAGLALATVAPAFAQAPPAETGDNVPVVQEVIVTGSRIPQPNMTSTSPIQVLNSQEIRQQGASDAVQLLSILPQNFQGASTDFSNTSNALTSAGGLTTADLRGLGPQRTLVLVDGRRLGSADPNTLNPNPAPDLDQIPLGLIDRVEVVTGGASAVYGSDAIAGVVNFKLKRDFEGLLVDAQYGVTGEGDAASKQLSITGGGRFANDRGRAVLSLSYLDRDFAPRSDRSFFINSGIASNLAGGIFQADPANLPTQAALNSLFLGRYGGTAPPVRSQGLAINADGSLFTPGAPVLNYKYGDHDPYVLVNGRVGTPYGESQPLQTPLERYSVFLRTSYDLTEDLKAYAQVQYVDYKTTYCRPG
ncbi:MAG: TonB-dependent receptor [Gammaproteobacteria bacterium]|nr:TonB-dependent receptor [Gammaproteobacteria bacterium]